MNPDRSWFRYGLGIAVVMGGFALVAALIGWSVPSANRDAVMLAIGVVLGWGSSVVAFEFGSSPSERKASDAASEGPSGTVTDPLNVKEQS